MEVLILLLLICLTGLLVMSEMALVSSRRVRLEQAANRGSRGAAAALQLAASPTRFLSVVQVGITLFGIIIGALGEATMSRRLEARLDQWPLVQPYSGVIATAIVVIAVTYVSVMLGELIPKRLALASPERIASMMALPMNFLAHLAAPVVWFLSMSTELALRLIGLAGGRRDDEVTADDIRSLIEHGTQSGVFLEKEQELVERIFRLGGQRVSSLMVPRADISWLEADAPAERIRIAVATESHSHFPVCRRGLDNLLGVVHLKDMVKAGLLQQRIDLKVLARQPLFVPEVMPALKVLEEFRKGQTHIAFVLDEYGMLTGLITLNDLVESMLGHMSRAGEDSEPLVVRRADGSWLLDGALPVAELKSLMQVDALPNERRTTFNTIAGFIMTYLGRVPSTGDTFTWQKYRFEIVDMDRHRIDKVLLSFAHRGDGDRLHSEEPE